MGRLQDAVNKFQKATTHCCPCPVSVLCVCVSHRCALFTAEDRGCCHASGHGRIEMRRNEMLHAADDGSRAYKNHEHDKMRTNKSQIEELQNIITAVCRNSSSAPRLRASAGPSKNRWLIVSKQSTCSTLVTASPSPTNGTNGQHIPEHIIRLKEVSSTKQINPVNHCI